MAQDENRTILIFLHVMLFCGGVLMGMQLNQPITLDGSIMERSIQKPAQPASVSKDTLTWQDREF